MIRTVTLLLLTALVLGGCGSPPVEANAPVIETGIDPDTWVEVPAGSFLMGQHEHKMKIEDDYEIMVTDVTNAQYADFLNTAISDSDVTVKENAVVGYYPGDAFHGYDHEMEIRAGTRTFVRTDSPLSRLIWDGAHFGVTSGYENHPMTMVSWFGAWGYCRFYGWRLPTDAEWEKAARGTDNRAYPWGTEITNNRANFFNSDDIFEQHFEWAGRTTPVGFYNGSTYEGYKTLDAASPYGLYDMAGNVWQWIGDVRVGIHYRSLRGGSHTNHPPFLRIWAPNNADPRHVSPNVGFRCAREH